MSFFILRSTALSNQSSDLAALVIRSRNTDIRVRNSRSQDNLQPLLREGGHAVWLLPTPRFRQAAFASRGTEWDIARRTTAPERARRNLLQRDHMFTRRLSAETRHLELSSIRVDTGISERELVDRVVRAFEL